MQAAMLQDLAGEQMLEVTAEQVADMECLDFEV
jgi:hypothetical protein